MNKKVAFYIPKLNGGGAERVVVNLVNEMSNRQDMEVFLFVSKLGGEYDDLISNRVNFQSLGDKKLILSLPPLLRLLKENQIQTLITGMPFPNLLGVICKKMLPNINLIITEHNDLRNQKDKSDISLVDRLTPIVIKSVYNHADGVIAVSKGVSDFLLELNHDIANKTKVIYNPIISGYMYKKSVELIDDYEFDNNTLYIVAVARLTQQKNLELFIETVNNLREKIGVKGLIIGQGEDEISLREKCYELNCQDNIEFLGFKSNPYKYIKNSDILLMTSYWEGFGNVLVEAAALGTKIVSVDCPSGPREIIEKLDFGCLVMDENPDCIAEIILNEANEMSTINKNNLLNFDVVHITDKYIDMIAEMG